MNQSAVYQHFRPSEQRFIDQVFQWIETVESQYYGVLTPFLDPRQQFIVQTLFGSREAFQCHFYGGFPEAEQQRAYICPAYEEVTPETFQLAAFQIKYPHRFAKLTHRQILGTLLGSGIQRRAIGDCITVEDQWYCVVDSTIAQYLHT